MATRTSTAIPRDLRFEPTPKRVRAQAAGETVADSGAALLVWEPNRAVPVYAFPAGDVRADLLADSANPLPDAHGGGATFYTLTAGGEPIENAAWRYADPDLAGHVALSWEALDRWLEEEDEVFGHPRDPRHYEKPFADAPEIAGLVCFLNERADVTVDGVAGERPTTQWSGGIRSAPRGGGSGSKQGPHETSDV
jgi:uncharacterized protein (DUF427 family)